MRDPATMTEVELKDEWAVQVARYDHILNRLELGGPMPERSRWIMDRIHVLEAELEARAMAQRR